MSLLNVLLESLIREFDGSQEQNLSIKQMIANHPGAFMLKCTEILSDMSELTAQYIQILRLMLQASQSITRTMLDSEIAVIQCTMILKRTINKVISQPNEDVNTIITDLHVRLMGISEDLVINHISDFFESGRVPEVVILRIIKEIFRTGTKEYFRQFAYEILQKILSSLSLVKLDAQRLDYCDLLETIYKALLYFQENDVPVNSEQVQQVTWLIFDQVKDWLSTNTNIAVLSLIGFMCQFISKDRLERSVEKLNGIYLQVLKSKTPLRQLFEGFNKFLERLYALDRQFYENIIKSITVSIYEFFKSPVFSPNYPFDEKNLKSKNDLLSLLQTLSKFNIDNCLDLFIARINSKEHIERISCLWLCHFLISRNFKQISEPYKKQLVMQLLNLQFEQDAELRFAICEIIFQFCQQLREDPIQYIDMKALMFYLLQQVSIHDREIEEYGRVKSAPFETTLEILKQRAQKILWTVSNEFPTLMWPMSIEIINNQKFSPGLSNIFKCLSNIVPKLEVFKFQTPHIVLVRILLLIQIPYFFQNLGLEGIIFLPHLLRNLDIKVPPSGYQIIENLRLHLSQKLEINFAYEDRVIQLWKVILLSLIQNVQLSVIEEDFQAQMSTYITSTALKLPIMRMQATLTSFLMNQETIKYSLDRLFSICHPEYVNQTINLNIQITEPDLNLRVCVAECFGYIGERHPQLTLEKVKTIMNSEVIQKKSSGGLKDMISMFQRSNDNESVQSVRGTLILALGSISRHVPLEMIERQILPNVLPFLETQTVYLNIALEKIAKSIDLSLEQNEEQVVQQFLNQFTRSRDAILERAYKNIKEPRCINIINLMMRLQSVIDYTKLCAHLKLHLEVHPTEAFENLFPLFLGIVRVEEDGQMLSMWQTLLMLLNSIKDHEELLEVLQKTMQRHKLRLESQHRYAFRVLLVLLSIMYQGNSRASVFIIEKVLLSMNIFIDIHQRTDDAFNQQIVIELIPKLQPPEMNILLQEIQNILNENVNHSGFSSLLLAAYEKIELTKYLQLVQSLRITESPTLKEILSRLARDNLHKTLQILLEQQSQFPLSEFNLMFILEVVNNRGTLIKSIAFLTDVLNNPEDIITSSIGNYMVNASLFLGQILDNECVSELIPKAFPQLLSTFLLRFMTSQDHPNAPESAVWAFQNLLKLRTIEGISQSVLKKLTLESEVSDGIEEIMMIYKCDVQEKRKIFDFMRGFTEKKSIAYRLAAVIVIGQFVRDNKNSTPDFYSELLEVLLSMDHDNSEKVRSQVALGLGSVSYCEQDLELMPEILASLMESLDDPQECCVRSAMISIQHLISFVPPELVQTLIIKVSGSFESQSPRIRISAFNLFAKLCVPGNQIPPHALISVILHLLDESVSVRQVCKLALEKLGDVMEQPKFKEISNCEFQYENAAHLEDNERMILGVVLSIDLDPETVIEFCNSPDQNIRGAAIYTIILMKALKNIEDQRIEDEMGDSIIGFESSYIFEIMIDQQLTLEQIDFDWVKEEKKISNLKKALKLIEQDGNYFIDLKTAIEDRLKVLDPKFNALHTPIDDTTVKAVKQEMDQFVEKPCESQNIRLAENERNKGNEALRSNDLKEALNYYTKSIQYDNTMAASYCNRALVYLKLKEYQNVISDCNQALILQKSYTKALHRRGKAYFALKDYIKAYLDFKEIIKIEPDNSEVNGELRECRKMVTDQEIKTAENQEFLKTQGAFKKVQIQEEDEEEEIPVSKTQDYSKEIADVENRKNQIAVQIQKGLYADSIDNIIELLKETHGLIGKCESTSLRVLRVSLFSNLALCYHQLQDYKKVIEYSKIILEDQQVPNDMFLKAHLRCGLAYEALDDLPNSKDHFSQVKAMDPGNLQASQGLARLSKIMTTEEHSIFEQKQASVQQQQQLEPKKPQEQQQQQNQQLKKPMIQEQSKCGLSDAEVFDQLKKIKDSGNELYKQKKYSEAHDAFVQGIAFYESNPAPIHLQLLVQLITNSCLCLSFIDRNDDIIELSKKAIDIDPNNLKALYRRGVAYQSLAIKNPDLEAQNALFELSRNDLEKVAYLDTANKQAIDKLAEVQRQNVECRVKLKEQKPKVDPLPEKVIAPKQEAPIVKQNITASQTQQIAQGLALNVINDILAKKAIPDSASTFEKNMNTFKKATPEQVMDYAFLASNLTTLYAKKDIPTEIILQIIKAGQTTQGLKKEELTIIFRDRIPKTAKFDLCTKMLSKKEKEDLRHLFADLGLDELQNTYKI